jgi:hypothetical protein
LIASSAFIGAEILLLKFFFVFVSISFWVYSVNSLPCVM